MESSEVIAVALIATALILTIYYYIIQAAVKSALSEQNELLRRQLRIMKRQLEKEGLNKAEISAIMTKD
jgi:hypothetical protein